MRSLWKSESEILRFMLMADYLHAPIDDAFRTRVMFTTRRCGCELMRRGAHVSRSSSSTLNAAVAASAFISSASAPQKFPVCRRRFYTHTHHTREREREVLEILVLLQKNVHLEGTRKGMMETQSESLHKYGLLQGERQSIFGS